MVVKRLFSLQNVKIVFTKCNEKIVRNVLFFRKKLFASPINGKPPPPDKNNGPSLIRKGF